MDDKVRDLLNAGREIAGDEVTDKAIAFLEELEALADFRDKALAELELILKGGQSQ